MPTTPTTIVAITKNTVDAVTSLSLLLLLARHLGARPACLGEPDGDRLLPRCHSLARAPRLQRPVLPLVHRLLDFLLRLGSVLPSSSTAAGLFRCHLPAPLVLNVALELTEVAVDLGLGVLLRVSVLLL